MKTHRIIVKHPDENITYTFDAWLTLRGRLKVISAGARSLQTNEVIDATVNVDPKTLKGNRVVTMTFKTNVKLLKEESYKLKVSFEDKDGAVETAEVTITLVYMYNSVSNGEYIPKITNAYIGKVGEKPLSDKKCNNISLNDDYCAEFTLVAESPIPSEYMQKEFPYIKPSCSYSILGSIPISCILDAEVTLLPDVDLNDALFTDRLIRLMINFKPFLEQCLHKNIPVPERMDVSIFNKKYTISIANIYEMVAKLNTIEHRIGMDMDPTVCRQSACSSQYVEQGFCGYNQPVQPLDTFNRFGHPNYNQLVNYHSNENKGETMLRVLRIYLSPFVGTNNTTDMIVSRLVNDISRVLSTPVTLTHNGNDAGIKIIRTNSYGYGMEIVVFYNNNVLFTISESYSYSNAYQEVLAGIARNKDMILADFYKLKRPNSFGLRGYGNTSTGYPGNIDNRYNSINTENGYSGDDITIHYVVDRMLKTPITDNINRITDGMDLVIPNNHLFMDKNKNVRGVLILVFSKNNVLLPSINGKNIDINILSSNGNIVKTIVNNESSTTAKLELVFKMVDDKPIDINIGYYGKVVRFTLCFENKQVLMLKTSSAIKTLGKHTVIPFVITVDDKSKTEHSDSITEIANNSLLPTKIVIYPKHLKSNDNTITVFDIVNSLKDANSNVIIFESADKEDTIDVIDFV